MSDDLTDKRYFVRKGQAGMSGQELIDAERRRQKEEEHCSDAVDDTYRNEELESAAWCYFSAMDDSAICPSLWPFNARYWKPKSRRENLIRAGALYKAERDRLARCDDSRLAGKIAKCEGHIRACAALIDAC